MTCTSTAGVVHLFAAAKLSVQSPRRRLTHRWSPPRPVRPRQSPLRAGTRTSLAARLRPGCSACRCWRSDLAALGAAASSLSLQAHLVSRSALLTCDTSCLCLRSLPLSTYAALVGRVSVVPPRGCAAFLHAAAGCSRLCPSTLLPRTAGVCSDCTQPAAAPLARAAALQRVGRT